MSKTTAATKTTKTQTQKGTYYRAFDPSIFAPMPRSSEEGRVNVREEIYGDEWESFLADIKARGILSPVIVAPAPKGSDVRYYIIAGERRWTAFRTLHEQGVTETDKGDPLVLPYILRQVADEGEATEIMAVENLQRKNLSPLEKAEVIKRMEESGLSVKEIAQRLNKTQVWVYQLKALLDKGSSELQKAVAEGRLTAQAAATIAKRVAPQEQGEAVERVLKEAQSKTDQTRVASQITGSRAAQRPGKRQVQALFQALLDVDPKMLLELEPVGTDDAHRLAKTLMEWVLGGKTDKQVARVCRQFFGKSFCFPPKKKEKESKKESK